MGATNTTANYSLSQFIGTDKPAWLQDYNGDMLKIDTGINAAKVAADGAQNSADAAQNDATTANNAITNTINPAISSLNTTVGNQGGAINTINSLIGNGTPTTTDQTIIGAINEINAKTESLIPCFNGKTLTNTIGPVRNASYTAVADCLAMVSYGHVNDSQLGAWASINSIDNIYQAALTSTGGTTSSPSYEYTFVVALKAGDTVSVRDNSGIYGLIKVFS